MGANPRDFGLDAYGPVGRSRWLDVDWRAHQRWVTVDGQAVNVVELGGEEPASAGREPVVFVHGLSGSWPNWLEQLPVVGAERRVVAMDLPGFGHSPMPREEITISGYGRLLDGLMDELSIDTAVLVGNSMGGFIACELAIGFPQRVERLVLVSAAGLSTSSSPRGERALSAVRRAETALAASAAWVAARSDAATRRARLRELLLSVVVRHPGRLPAALAAEQVRGSGTPGFIQAFEAVVDYDVRERLPEIACPTLIVWGDRDRLIPVRDAHLFAELIPDSRLVVFPDTGHLAMLERPAAFNALLEEFIAK